MRWANINLQCLDCHKTVLIEPNEDWTEFTGKCDCGQANLTDHVKAQVENF